MKLIVCGDSFMSADTGKPGSHFSEMLTNHGYTVTNLARGGISNTGIGFQIQTAIQLRPHAVIFSSAGPDRIDIVVKNRKFDPAAGLKNFIYPYRSDQSTGSEHVGDLTASILSDVIPAFLHPRLDTPKELVDPDRSESVKQYLAWGHDNDFKTIVDDWIIGYWRYQLIEHAIPFIHVSRQSDLGQSMYRYVDDHPEKINQAVYHTDVDTQLLLTTEFANQLQSIIKS